MRTALLLALSAGVASSALAASTYDEGIDGPLSNDPLAPTVLDFSAGDNFVTGVTLGSGTPPSDGFDVFQFDIEAGETLTSIFLTAYDPATGGTSGFNFSTGAAASQIGAFVIFGPGAGGANVGVDFLANDLNGGVPGAQGAGTYFMEVREFGGPEATWTLNFVVVPAPASAGVLAMGGLLAVRRRR